MKRDHNLIERAIALSVSAHQGQMRKEALMPYIVHPVSVAIILSRYGFSDIVIAAGLVHDVVEDTTVDIDQLRHQLGDEVADIVAPVSHDNTLSWEEKKKAYIESVREAGDDAKAVSLADKISNAYSLIEAHKVQGDKIWTYFNAGREKKLWFEHAMLSMYRATWSHPMVDEYEELVKQIEEL